jgi:hypothetical protein
MHGGFNGELLNMSLHGDQLGDWVGQGAERDGMHARGIDYYRHFNGQLGRQVGNGTAIVNDAGFDEPFLI